MSARIRDAAIGALFLLALAFATAPLWRSLAWGFNPTLDQLLEIRCRTR